MSLLLSRLYLHLIIHLAHMKSKLSSHRSWFSNTSTSYFMGNSSIHSGFLPFLLCKPKIYLNLQSKHSNPKLVNPTRKMSNSTIELSHKPKSYRNEATFNHPGDIQEIEITQSNLNLTIKDE